MVHQADPSNNHASYTQGPLLLRRRQTKGLYNRTHRPIHKCKSADSFLLKTITLGIRDWCRAMLPGDGGWLASQPRVLQPLRHTSTSVSRCYARANNYHNPSAWATCYPSSSVSELAHAERWNMQGHTSSQTFVTATLSCSR